MVNFFKKYKSSELDNLPKYAQLREILRRAIGDGFWEIGDKLPAELDIAQSTPFSLGTVQKALGELAADGSVERRHGYGTYVTDNRMLMVDPWHFRFRSSDSDEIAQVFPKVLSKNKIHLKTNWARQIDPEDTGIIQIDRVISIADKFSIYSKFFLSAKRFGGFLKKSNKILNSSNFKTILHREYNISFANIAHALQLIPFSNNICRAINVPKRTMGMIMEIMVGSTTKNPIYYQEVYIPPSDFKLIIMDASTIPQYWR